MASEFPKDTVGQPPVGGGMVGRIKRLLMSPAEEWKAIDAEPDTAKGVFLRWAAPLAAIPAICSFIGMQVFGIGFLLVHFRPSIVYSAVSSGLSYVGALAGVWVLALVIDALAPSFGSTKNQDQAMKVAAYSYTAAWVAGVLNLIPALAPIGMLVGLYSFYLLWVGLPILMKTAADKAAGYTIVSVVVSIGCYFIIAWVIGMITANMLVSSAAMMPGGTGSVTFGGTTIDTGKLEAQAAAIKESTEKMQASLAGNGNGAGTKAVDPAALQNLIPASLSGWNRTSIESTGGGALGVNVSDATAQFAAGDQSFHLKISDTGAVGALAGLVNVNSSSQTATGYKKTSLQDGNMVTEEWDNSSKSGTYSVLVGKRFVVEAEGSAPSIDVLKSAVGSVNLGQLAALAS
ncbi:MAG: YIP1 family protein [Sphingomonas sp.]|uniref:Yip1 family protein n=1 Tax=Sphingomonas sp. TaxID=28214 RepID=UPI001226D53D|nr:Yip1 family protein [Sphingomonas sp.]THD37985.1 MAG: YIP1 family protein [Sphingomonas sp.]